MSNRLPPLNSLRAFESAARHLSFRKAAEELHVTPAAVSHQIKILEEQLGIQLFRRLTRAVELTEAGSSFLPKLSEAFEVLAQAVNKVRAREKTGALSVNVPPSFAAKWLMPRLHRFVTAYPDIDIRIIASMRLVDMRHQDASYSHPDEHDRAGDFDIDIRFGSGKYPRSRVDKLFEVSFTPLCSPHLLEGMRPLKKPADLRYHLLLHDEIPDFSEEWPNWAQWLKAAGVEDIDASRGPHFSHPILGLEAAVDEMGVALGVKELAAYDLAAGRLVAPFDLVLEMDSAYYLVVAETSADHPKVKVFREWLLKEALDSNSKRQEADQAGE
ncbi:MAG: transcriptional regulator GcvA [Proteobacteria bacterium]|nr:transcriptional regulator GcvA [Pseudomonadota bacterium]